MLACAWKYLGSFLFSNWPKWLKNWSKTLINWINDWHVVYQLINNAGFSNQRFRRRQREEVLSFAYLQREEEKRRTKKLKYWEKLGWKQYQIVPFLRTMATGHTFIICQCRFHPTTTRSMAAIMTISTSFWTTTLRAEVSSGVSNISLYTTLSIFRHTIKVNIALVPVWQDHVGRGLNIDHGYVPQAIRVWPPI